MIGIQCREVGRPSVACHIGTTARINREAVAIIVEFPTEVSTVDQTVAGTISLVTKTLV